MAEITAQQVKQLRERTGAGMMECKSALVEAKGDLNEAEVVLRKRGIASANKKAARATKQGVIGTYIHPGAQLGVLVEVNCESDFVARTDDFQGLVHDHGHADRRRRSSVHPPGRRYARGHREGKGHPAGARLERGESPRRWWTASSKGAW